MTILLALFWLLSFIGATQDIASDGVYVTSLDRKSQSLFCGIQSLSWNVGPIVATGGLVYLSGFLHSNFFHHDAKIFGADWVDAWQIIFFIVAGVTLLMAAWHARVMPKGAKAENTPKTFQGALHILWDAFVTFFQKKDIWLMVAFAFLFRLRISVIANDSAVNFIKNIALKIQVRYLEINP